jgi:hypothetical protein
MKWFISVVYFQDIKCLLNIQHNCHDSRCSLAKNHRKKIERRETTIGLWGVEHANTNSFIINAASHYSGHIHRQLADLELTPVSPEQWDHAIKLGLKVWNSEPRPAKNGNNNTKETNDS